MGGGGRLDGHHEVKARTDGSVQLSVASSNFQWKRWALPSPLLTVSTKICQCAKWIEFEIVGMKSEVLVFSWGAHLGFLFTSK